MPQAMIMPKKYFFDKDGNPLAYGKVYTYQKGTTINKETFTKGSGGVPNTNPVILNGEGYASIYLDGSYNIVVDDQNDNNIWTEDPVSSNTNEEWVNCQSATYVSTTEFKINGNVTSQYEPDRRVQIDNDSGGIAYSVIVSSSFAAGETTVKVLNSVVLVTIVGVCTSIVGPQSVVPVGDIYVLHGETLQEAIDEPSLQEGFAINVAEAIDGGGAMWDVFDNTVEIPNGDNIRQCSQIDTLSIKRRDNTRIGLQVDGIESDLGDVAVLASEGESSFTNPGDIVQVPISDNKADPNIADVAAPRDTAPAITDTASMLHRLKNNGNGTNSVQSPSTLGTFAVSRKYDVIENTQYTISMAGAPLRFQFYQIDTQLIFFNSDGTFHSNIGGGSNVLHGNRQATFTVPVGAEKVAFNLRNPVDFSNSNPMTESAFEACVNAIMLNLGSTALPFSEFSDGNFTPTASLFNPTPPGEIEVTKQESFFYIRTPCQQSPDKDVVWRVLANHGESIGAVNSRSGVVDFYGVRFIDKSEVDTKAAFNLSTEVHNAGIDESCPIRYNEMFQAGGHGSVGYTANMVAHGKTNVDVGSIWTDGTDEWVLTFINSVDGVTLLRRNTGTVDKWVISSADFGSTTLTHVSGATDTANIVMTSSTQYQVIPIIRDYLAEMRVDDVAVTANSENKGQRAVLSETYSLMNIASQQAWLISDVGNSNPDYINDAITEQVRFYYEYEWNEFGAMSIRSAHGVKEDYRRAPLNGYWGALQLQRLSLTGDSDGGMHSKVFVYIPEVAPVSGLDFQNVAEVTTNAIEVFVPSSSCDDPADPASHYSLIGKDGSDVTLSGHVFGYSRGEGLGIPATRGGIVDTIFRLSAAEKNYPYAIDEKAGDAVAGQVDEMTAFRAPFLPTDTELTIPAVIATMSGKTYCYITAHQDLTDKQVAIPSKYNGWPVTVVKPSDNVTVKSGFVSEGFIEIDVINDYGDVVLRLGG